MHGQQNVKTKSRIQLKWLQYMYIGCYQTVNRAHLFTTKMVRQWIQKFLTESYSSEQVKVHLARMGESGKND